MFLSTHVNKVDRKGRVSVPATFRAALPDPKTGIIAFPSFQYDALEGCGPDRMGEIVARIEALDLFSEERDRFESLVLAKVCELPFDTEGRIILPGKLIEHAKITDSVAFVGKGRSFQMWAPAAFGEHQAVQEETARRKGAPLTLAAVDRRHE